MVVLEKLPATNMTRRARPVADPNNPGGFLPNGAAAKSGLTVVKVPAAFTSQRCSACGHVDPKSRDSQAVFRCTHCLRPAEHADVNAANNIRPQGLRSLPAENPPHPRARARR
ncbi:MAG: zinc ribbon domain-containing protein [Mycobacterium sp.]|nr:zinc ribbon domain-containing protein [Mycobacterium sp.]